MSDPAYEQLRIRDRVAELFGGKLPGAEIEHVRTRLKEISGNCANAMGIFLPSDFEFSAPVARQWSYEDEANMPQAARSAIVRLRDKRTDSIYSVYLHDVLIEMLIRVSFGGSDNGSFAPVSRDISGFDEFFLSDFCRTLLAELLAKDGSADPMSIQILQFRATGREAGDEEIEPPPGFLSQWRVTIGRIESHLAIHFPESDFAVADEAKSPMPGDSGEWSATLESKLAATSVTLQAVISARSMTLGELKEFRTGKVVELGQGNTSPVVLDCEGEPLYVCAIGQKDGRLAVNIQEQVNQWNAFIASAVSSER